jgi:energy-converting hydrogenase B subunit D
VTAIQAAALVFVGIGGTALVFARDPLRQTFVLSLYGFALTILFFAVAAPDVALSEIVVGGIAMPVIILAALRKIAEEDERRARAQEDE